MADGTLFVLGKGVLFDSGQIAPGAKVFFYLAGSSTKVPIYTTSALAIQHSNPVQSDINGKLPSIWLDQSLGPIKYVVARSTDTDPPAAPLDTQDNYPVGLSQSPPFYATTSAETAVLATIVDASYPEGHVYRYGTNTTPGTTDMASAINAAISVMAQHTNGGVVQFPAAICRVASTINAAANVTLQGQGGQASQILADGCDAITLDFTTYYGQTVIRDLYILGTNSSTHTGIIAPGTLDNADQLYGLTVERCFIRNFNVGIHYRTVWHSRILNSRIEDIDRAVELIGQCIGMHMRGNYFIHTSGGGGAGSAVGITLDSFNYTDGAGSVPTEGIQIKNNVVYGFDTAFRAVLANFVNLTHNDLYGAVTGIDITTVNLGCNVTDNYLDLNSATLTQGIYLKAVGAAASAKINIVRNSLTCNNASAAVGIQVGDASNGGQECITIVDNSLSGFPTNDILVNHAGTTWIERNKCSSSAPTNSISVPAVSSGTVFIRDNICAKAINYVAADAAAGSVIVSANIVSGTTQLNYAGKWTSPAYSSGDYTASGSMSWTVGSGDVATYEYTIIGNTMTVNLALNTTTVGGTPSTTLKVAIPAGKTAAQQAYNALGYFSDNGTVRAGSISVAAAGTTINIDRTDGSNMTAATDATYVKGSLTFEIQ